MLTLLTRKNTITRIQYRNDPTIFAWELINEPQCMTDRSGNTLQDWIEEMSAFVKSIDMNHLVTVGLEGFYGPKSPKRLTVNPAGIWANNLGSDFNRNSKILTIDFASLHIYPDHWFHDQDLEEKLEYVANWTDCPLEKAINISVDNQTFMLASNGSGCTAFAKGALERIVFKETVKNEFFLLKYEFLTMWHKM
ncbi:Mannan endo-1,4-beta-mannosidase 2 [Camellia lanceoleosa]|uniref:Mannan endo-1,4-beta-mannosidase 2 n=1 Tax=Camellia lanceoleosa TaxID=1840588 RepID=A0ACC0G3K3_9ERIC|nr:Mannan endo-1,4-beta-mannosidase 2 [Camellia lanceoleosa]